MWLNNRFLENDQLLASAARFLIDGQEEDAASVLLSCSLRVSWGWHTVGKYALDIKLTGPRATYEILCNEDHPITQAILNALCAVFPEDAYIEHFTPCAELVGIDPDWRAELLEIARGKGVHNQAVEAAPARIWNNLRFRSESEVRIAQALDRAGVLFLPNCKARLGSPKGRRNREADFLVCYEGKWGILEVDGEPFHPPSRTAEDHERDRLFHDHGILVVQHFDASECFENPDGIVGRFLGILKKAYPYQ
jgi:hypothetical protein